MTVATTLLAKGSTLLSTLAFVAETAGDDAHQRVLDRLGDADRRALAGLESTDEVEFAFVQRVWRATDAVLAPVRPDWAVRSGEFSIESTGTQLYGGIVRKSSPLLFLTQGISLFQLYYRPGNMEVVESSEDRAVLRLIGFDHDEPIFCQRQTGGLACALAIAGGKESSVAHVRCALEGDAYCEWELRWG